MATTGQLFGAFVAGKQTVAIVQDCSLRRDKRMQREDTYSDNALTCRDEVCGENDSIFGVSRGENWRDGTICELGGCSNLERKGQDMCSRINFSLAYFPRFEAWEFVLCLPGTVFNVSLFPSDHTSTLSKGRLFNTEDF